jgi:membrane fusion protein, copper/silver efflux system
MKLAHVSAAAVAAVVGLAAVGFGAYRAGSAEGVQRLPIAAVQGAEPSTGAAGRRVLYWHDPMVPNARFDKPGKSPFMNMALVPVYADDTGEPGITVAPGVLQNLGVRLAAVRRAPLGAIIEAVGTVAQNERSLVTVQTRVTGYVEQLHVRATLDPVTRGAALATIYAPEWAGAMTEYLALRVADVDAGIVAAARQRLRLLSIPDEVVEQSVRQGAAQTRFTLTAPISGVVAELGVREGEMAAPGMPLFRLVDLGTVWAMADIPEAQSGEVAVGNRVEARAHAHPDRIFRGRLSAILPEVDSATRTLRARVELANPGQVLKPGMFVRLALKPGTRQEGLVVPQEAVIATGKRNVVIVAHPAGRFEPVEVTLGRSVGADVEVRSGLADGQQVVASGQFLIDSEASLRSVLPRLMSRSGEMASAGEPARAQRAPTPRAHASDAVQVHVADGVVESVEKDEVMLSHGPVPTLKWPPMTMGFKLPAAARLPAPKPGDRVRFGFVERDGEYVITRIEPAGVAR